VSRNEGPRQGHGSRLSTFAKECDDPVHDGHAMFRTFCMLQYSIQYCYTTMLQSTNNMPRCFALSLTESPSLQVSKRDCQATKLGGGDVRDGLLTLLCTLLPRR